MAKADWLTISPTSGSGDATIENIVAKNEGRNSRSTEVTGIANGVVPNKTYTVNQDGATEFITLDDASITAMSGGTVTITGKSNAPKLMFSSDPELMASIPSTYKVNDVLAVSNGMDIDGDPGASGAFVFAIDITIPSVSSAETKTLRVSGNDVTALVDINITLPVAVLVNASDNTDIHNFASCAEAATYATNNSSTNWELTIKEGEVPESCFQNLTNLVALTLEEGVTSIGQNAFAYCSSLKGSLAIPEGVTTIGAYAFISCAGFNGTLTLPSTLTRIYQSAFNGCSGFTGDLIIPDSIQCIVSFAFTNCSGFNGSLKLPNGNYHNIQEYTFYGCSGLTGSLVIPEDITNIGNYAFNGCSGFDDDLRYDGTSNPGIDTVAFGDTNFTECIVNSDYEDDNFCELPVRVSAIGGIIPSE